MFWVACQAMLAAALMANAPASPVGDFLARLNLEEHRGVLKRLGFKGIEKSALMSSANSSKPTLDGRLKERVPIFKGI